MRNVAATTSELPVSLAPMEGVTGFPLRVWMHLAAAPAALATPFLRVTETFPHGALPRAFAPELDELRGAFPYQLVPQIMAAEGADFIRAAPLLLKHSSFIELNCGCPSPTCVGKGAGSSLLRDADELNATVGSLAKALGPERVAVKMRTGFQHDGEFRALLAALSDQPLARLTVHGRTRPARYTGSARWDLIEAAAQQARSPVYASGDVTDHATLKARLTAAPHAAGVLVGRGALRNPWVFAELRAGEAVKLSFAALKLALMTQAVLHELMATNMDALFALAKDGVFHTPCETSEERWREVYARLSCALFGRVEDFAAGSEAILLRPTLGRVKMLWNYLRSSLPEAFFAPAPLRASTFPAFLQALAALHLEAGAPKELSLVYQPKWDWLYSGEKRESSDGAHLH